MRTPALVSTLLALVISCAPATRPVTSPANLPTSATAAAKLHLPGYLRGSKDSHAQRVIIFVHGIFGDGTSTWMNTTNGAYFPALVQNDKSFDGVDIWVHEFDSPKLRRSYTIDELADHMRKYLNNDNVIANHQELIFVCHSMGGLVARAYLLKYRDVAPERVRMMYFFSTPTTGSDLANLAHLISANPQLVDMRKMTTDDAGVLGVWESQWSSSPFAQRTLSYCAYELLPTHGVIVVQRESARHLCNTRPDPIERNHIDIVKPANNVTDESYVAFREAYRDTFDRKQQDPPVPRWNLTSKDAGLVRAQNLTQTPNCHSTCWSDHIVVAPGDDINFDLSYRNARSETATDARLYLTIPEGPLFDASIIGTLTSANTASAFGAVELESSGGPVLLIPTDIWAYDKNDASKTHEIPYKQKAAALIGSDGFRLGDVSADRDHHHIVVQFHCEPVSLVGVANPEGLMDIVKGLMRDEIDLAQPLAMPDGPGGHIDTGEIGEQTRWVSDLRDVHNGSSMMLYLYHFNNTPTQLRQLRARIRLDPDDPTTLRVTLTSAEGVIRSATAHIAYRPGSTERPVLVGAWHAPKAPLVSFERLRKMSEQELKQVPADFPIHADEIDFGDLTPQAQAAAIVVLQMSAGGEERTHPTGVTSQTTVLNGDEGEWVLRASNSSGRELTEYIANYKSGSPLGLCFLYHNTGHAVARNVRLGLTMSTTTGQLVARGTITTSNAPQLNGVARVALPNSRATFYYDQALLFRFRSDEGRLLDAGRITQEGIAIGDLDPGEWGALAIRLVAGVSPEPDASCNDVSITPGSPFELMMTFDNTTNAVIRDVMLGLHVDGGPNDFAITSNLSSVGKVLRSRIVRMQSDLPAGVTLRYRDTTIYTTTGVREIDTDAADQDSLIGDIPPRTQLVLSVRYEVLSNDD